MTNKDFKAFSTGHLKISSTYFDSYSKLNTTHHILDDIGEGVMIDIFSKLLDSRIIFLSTEMDSDICNIIKAQLLYLEQFISAM
jgi:hypothetical protein